VLPLLLLLLQLRAARGDSRQLIRLRGPRRAPTAAASARRSPSLAISWPYTDWKTSRSAIVKPATSATRRGPRRSAAEPQPEPMRRPEAAVAPSRDSDIEQRRLSCRYNGDLADPCMCTGVSGPDAERRRARDPRAADESANGPLSKTCCVISVSGRLSSPDLQMRAR
jgi:hypothetical protein